MRRGAQQRFRELHPSSRQDRHASGTVPEPPASDALYRGTLATERSAAAMRPEPSPAVAALLAALLLAATPARPAAAAHASATSAMSPCASAEAAEAAEA